MRLPTTRRTRAALLASVFGGAMIATPAAAQTVVSSNTTSNPAISVGGSGTVTVNSGVTLTAGGSTSRAITYDSAPTGTGPVITNNGTIIAVTGSGTSNTTPRVIDTAGTFTSRTLTVNNNSGALMRSTQDVIRILNGSTETTDASTVTVNNSGTMISISGDGIDLDTVRNTNLIVNNSGFIRGGYGAQDTGGAASTSGNGVIFGTGTINNSGTISGVYGISGVGTFTRGINLTGSGLVQGVDRGISLAGGTSNVSLISTSRVTGTYGIYIGGGTNSITMADGASVAGVDRGISFSSASASSTATLTGASTVTGNWGFYASGGTNTITLSDTSKVDATARALYFTNSNATASVNNVTLNSGTSVEGDAEAIYLSGSLITNTITLNSGSTVTGGTYGMYISGGTNTININSGATVNGATDGDTIYISGGNTTINLQTGATIGGALRGTTSASSVDTLNLSGTGTATAPMLSNFDAINVNSGDWTIALNTFSTNPTTIASGATLRLGDGGTTGALSGRSAGLDETDPVNGAANAAANAAAVATGGSIVNNGALVFNRSNVSNQSVGAAISGSGTLTILGGGTFALDGANSYSGATTITNGTLRADTAVALSGNSAYTLGSAGNLNLNGFSRTLTSVTGSGGIQLGTTGATLTFGSSNADQALTGVISGTGNLVKQGTGLLTLGGANTFVGNTTVDGGGLRLTGSLTGDVAVNAGTLSGTGSAAGTVTMANGTIVAPGTAGTAGTLTAGALVLNSGTVLNYDLGAPGTSNAAQSDRIVVSGNLTLDGTLNVNNVGGFGQGVYRLISYGGTLTDNGLTIGTMPGGTDLSKVTIQTSVAQQVNLVYGDASTLVPAIQFWDGGGSEGDSVISGGSGSWNTTTENWTRSNGVINDLWGEQFAVFGAAAGTVSVDGAIRFGGMQFMTDGYTVAAGTGTLSAVEAITSMRVDPGVTATISAAIGGTGGLTKLDTGTLVLSGANTYTGGTVVNGGRMRFAGTGSLTGALTVAAGAVAEISTAQSAATIAGDGTIELGARLTVGTGNANSSFAGKLTGTSGISKTGTGTLILSGANDYSGQTTLSAGILRLATGGSLGTGDLSMSSGTTLDLAGIATTVGNLSGGGTLAIGADGSLTVNQSGVTSYGGSITGARATLIKNGAGTLALTGNNSFSGGASVNFGVLSLGSATALANSSVVAIGSDATLTIGVNKTLAGLTGSGTVLLNGNTLTLSSANDYEYLGAIAGGGGIVKAGTGTLTLGGSVGPLATTTVSAGMLLINGTAAADVAVNGGTLGGTGTIAGTVTVASGAALTAGGVGTAGTLTMGNLVLTGGSNLNYDLGAATTLTGNDRLNVTGNVTLAGSLNINDIGQFGQGVYRLIDYGGTLTDNGIAFGTLPSGVAIAQLELQTSMANQVNLIVSGQLPDIQFWDGTGPGNDGAIAGGSGSWNNSAYNWTDASGQSNSRWGAKFAVFQGTGGTVTVDAPISYTGMQFTNNGFVIAPGTGTLAVTTAEGNIRVDSGVTARIDAAITGTGGLTKLDTGTLVLGGANTFGGATAVNGGTLRLAVTDALGGTSGVTVASGATLDIAAANSFGTLNGEGSVALNAGLSVATGAFTGQFTGTGALTKTGTGVLTLAGTSTHSGGTNLDAGTIRLSGATVLGTGAVTLATGTTLDLAGNSLRVNRLAGTGAVTLGSGALTVAEAAADGTYGGVISGTGMLIKAGAGTLTLTGANTYTGGTRIDAGTLALTTSTSIPTTAAVEVGAAGTLSIGSAKTIGNLSGAGSVVLGSNTLTVGSGNGTSSFTGVISGTGALTKTGTGTLTLGGANTFTGTTTISGGTLALAAGGSLASGVNVSASSGVLDVSAGNKTLAGLRGVSGAQVLLGSTTLTIAGTATETWGGTISGTGNVVKAGTNTLTFSSVNTYAGSTTITGGILRAGAANVFSSGALAITDGRLDLAGFDQTIGSLTGAGTVTLGAGTLTVGGNNATTSYDGVISGTGNLVKAGTGTLTLTANNTFTGFARVDAGKLVINGTLSGAAVNVAAGGRLGGNSTYASLDVAGTVTPGNSVGTIQTTGNVTFRAGSVYEVETNPTIGSDLIAAGGNVAIQGGTVRVMPLGTGYNPQTTYQIISAGGTVTGTFTNVTSDLAFLAPSLVYTTNAVNLVLRRTDTAFDTVAQTDNQTAVARAVQAAGSGTVFNQVLGQDTAGARRAFDELSGEVHASVPALAAYQAGQNRDAVLARLAEPVAGGVWLQYTSSKADIDADNGLATLDRRATGIRGGLDAGLFGVRVGIVVGHGTSDVDGDSIASRANLTGTHVGAYAGIGFGGFKLRAGAIVDSVLAKTYRNVSIGSFGDAPRGQGKIQTLQGFGEIAYTVGFGGWSVEPFAGASVTQVKAEQITETGGLAALDLGKVEESVVGARAGVRFNGALPLFSGSGLRLTGAVAVQNQDLDKVAQRSARFLATGQSFTIEGNRPGNTGASVDLGLALDAMGGTLSVRYVGEYSKNTKDHGIRAGLGWRF